MTPRFAVPGAITDTTGTPLLNYAAREKRMNAECCCRDSSGLATTYGHDDRLQVDFLLFEVFKKKSHTAHSQLPMLPEVIQEHGGLINFSKYVLRATHAIFICNVVRCWL